MGRDRVFIEENLLYLQLSQNGSVHAHEVLARSPAPPPAPPRLTSLA